MSMGEDARIVFKYLSVGSTKTGRISCVKGRARAQDTSISSCGHPSVTLLHPAREVGVLKRHGVSG